MKTTWAQSLSVNEHAYIKKDGHARTMTDLVAALDT